MSEHERVLRDVVTAWEKLEHGNRSIRAVQQWLTDDMSPAINRARDVLGLPNEPPDDD